MDFIYRASGEAAGFRQGRFVHAMSGEAIGQVHGDTHVHRMDGAYVGELFQDMVVDQHLGDFGNVGYPGDPGNAGDAWGIAAGHSPAS